jgi:hypothetical protein
MQRRLCVQWTLLMYYRVQNDIHLRPDRGKSHWVSENLDNVSGDRIVEEIL